MFTMTLTELKCHLTCTLALLLQPISELHYFYEERHFSHFPSQEATFYHSRSRVIANNSELCRRRNTRLCRSVNQEAKCTSDNIFVVVSIELIKNFQI